MLLASLLANESAPLTRAGEGAEQLDTSEAARLFEGALAKALLQEDGQLAINRLAASLTSLMPKLETQGQLGKARWVWKMVVSCDAVQCWCVVLWACDSVAGRHGWRWPCDWPPYLAVITALTTPTPPQVAPGQPPLHPPRPAVP